MKLYKEAKIGLIAIITIALFIWGYSFLKSRNIFKPRDSYYAVYDNIDGLIESSSVSLRGYKVGSVNTIKFDYKKSGKFIVKFSLEDRVRIPKNSVAQLISSSPISATKDMKLIFSNSNEYYEPGDTLLSGIDKGLSGVMDLLIKKAEVMLTSLDTSINSVNRVFDDSTRENLRKAIEDFGSVANSLHQSLGENGDINESMKNLKSVSQNLKNNNQQLTNIIHNVSSLSDSLSKTEIKTMIANANHSLINADSILASIKDGEGSLGLLVNNDTLYYNLKNASESLNQLLKDLYAHPKRYVHFSIFGKKDKGNKK